MVKNDKWHGQGTYYSDGDKYVGEFKEGKLMGQNFFYLADNEYKGDKYVGQFQNWERHGQGTYYYADGRIERNFKNGKLNGYAISYNADGSIDKQGIWKDDQFLSSDSQNNNQKVG